MFGGARSFMDYGCCGSGKDTGSVVVNAIRQNAAVRAASVVTPETRVIMV